MFSVDRKRINQKLWGCIAFILFAIVVLSSCRVDKEPSSETAIEFKEIIESGDLKNLSLTIYYVDPHIWTNPIRSVDALIKFIDGYSDFEDVVQKIIIEGVKLEEYDDFLNQINNSELVPVESDSFLDARIYYVFETKKGRALFDVVMWNSDESIVVNGAKVEYEDVFGEGIMQFLPEISAEQLGRYLDNKKQFKKENEDSS